MSVNDGEHNEHNDGWLIPWFPLFMQTFGLDPADMFMRVAVSAKLNESMLHAVIVSTIPSLKNSFDAALKRKHLALIRPQAC